MYIQLDAEENSFLCRTQRHEFFTLQGHVHLPAVVHGAVYEAPTHPEQVASPGNC